MISRDIRGIKDIINKATAYTPLIGIAHCRLFSLLLSIDLSTQRCFSRSYRS